MRTSIRTFIFRAASTVPFHHDIGRLKNALSAVNQRYSIHPTTAIESVESYNRKPSRHQLYDEYHLLLTQVRNVEELYQLAIDEKDAEVEEECTATIPSLQKDVQDLILNSIFSANDAYYRKNCFIEIHPGAGGTDAFDWVKMLGTMYCKWANQNNLKATILDEDPGDEGGSRFILIKLEGENAFGWIAPESGVHRLVRISPFDPAQKRHTSFAQVVTYPIDNESASLSIKMSDFKIETFRSSGPGGQHVNTTDSAVRITHLPTKTIVKCQNDRSQLRNRETAMTIMTSKLRQLQESSAAKARLLSSLGSEGDSWGNQIRSVVLQPYTMVKDHRTKWETPNTKAYLDGELLQEAIECSLLHDYFKTTS